MAEKNFFDQFNEKMAGLQPDVSHHESDWSALKERLDQTMPQPARRRRVLLLPILLAVALLSTNAAWWNTAREQALRIERLEALNQSLHTPSPKERVKTVVQRDTCWRVRYVRTREAAPVTPTVEAIIAQPSHLETTPVAAVPVAKPMAAVEPIPTLLPGMVAGLYPERPHIGRALVAAHHVLEDSKKREREPTQPIANRLRIGGGIGWLHAGSKGLMHEGGVTGSISAEWMILRRWSITAAYSLQRMHYKAHDTAAVIGAPTIPVHTYGHHLGEIDVTGQRARQFELGVQYRRSTLGRVMPFAGLYWAHQTLLPFTLEYDELIDPQEQLVHKQLLEVTGRQTFRDWIGGQIGIELPLSRRLQFSLNAFYQRRLHQPNPLSPNLMGIRTAISLSPIRG